MKRFGMRALSCGWLLAVSTFSITNAAWGDLATSVTVDGNVSAEVAAFAATGTSSPSGTLTLNSIPAGATVNYAALYAINYFASVTPSATFAGTSLGATSAFDTSAAGGLSAYRWPVHPSLIEGNATYSASATGLSNNYGLALVVVFSHSSLPSGRVIVNHGATNLNGGSPSTASTTFTVPSAGTGTLWIHTGADNAVGETNEVISFNQSAIGGPIDGNLPQSIPNSGASLFKLPVTTVAGTNTAQINSPSDYFGWDLAVLSVAGAPTGPTITTIAQNLDSPNAVAVDQSGNVYVADGNNHRILKILASNGAIEVYAGTGEFGFTGNGSALASKLNGPSGLTLDPLGNLYFVDTNNHRIGMVSPSGDLTTVAGSPTTVSSGFADGPAADARFDSPYGIVWTGGVLLVTDANNGRVRRVSLALQTVDSVAGGDLLGFSPDGTTALGAKLGGPAGIAVGGAWVLIAEKLNHRIRRFMIGGTLETVAGSGIIANSGTGQGGIGGDGGSATAGTDSAPIALLNSPIGLAVDTDGSILVGDSENHRVRKLTPNQGGGYTITTLAGTGTAGFSGDNGPASAAQLSNPTGVAAMGGKVFVVDQIPPDNQRVRKISNEGPVITLQ